MRRHEWIAMPWGALGWTMVLMGEELAGVWMLTIAVLIWWGGHWGRTGGV